MPVGFGTVAFRLTGRDALCYNPTHQPAECAADHPYRSAMPALSMSFTCFADWALALLLFPILILFWATESRQQRARRWRRDGWTQQRIADRLGCSRTTVRRMLATT